MTTKNDITGDLIIAKPNSDDYRNNYDAIFKKPESGTKDSHRVERCNCENCTCISKEISNG